MFRLPMQASLLRSFGVLTLGLSCVLSSANPAHAGWLGSVGQVFANIDEWRLDHTPENFTGPRAGRDFTMLAVRNNTNRPIRFAACWEPFRNPYDNSSTLSSHEGGPWTLQAWYTVEPGQILHFGNTSNGNFYIHATDDAGRVWAGPQQIRVGGQEFGFAMLRFAFEEREYTVNVD